MPNNPPRAQRRQTRAIRAEGKIVRKNRIHELWRERGWTAADVAERVRDLARERGDAHRINTAEGTINRLSTGKIRLDLDWMEMLGEVYGVPAGEIVTAPSTSGMRRVRVTHAFAVDVWSTQEELPAEEQPAIMVPDDARLRGVSLYAGEVRDTSMSQRYPQGALVVLSPLMQHPGEIAEGRRYHVRVMRADNKFEQTIKTLVKRSDAYWLKPESDDPQFQTWVPLGGDATHGKVDLVGRVRGVYLREE